MPQRDRYRDREVAIDFEAHERFDRVPCAGRFSLILVTDGSTAGALNGRPVEIAAPCALCLSESDRLTVERPEAVAAQTLSFAADFFGTSPDADIPTGLSVFERSDVNAGLFHLERSIYGKMREWFFIVGTEVFAQSDSLWVCRIKKYLIQMLGMLASLCRERENDPVRLAVNHICAHYDRKITLDELCRKARINRVSLNQMCRAQYGRTAMEYLNDYRMRMAEKILTYTRMNLNEVAHAVGFEYDTYFIRQFTRWKGMSPTQFRRISQRRILGEAELVL
ncbi:MAG: AraC family transcriptional regulator [Clostridia bacterium]|nr:AraC family transcriptional regulator [Clostridia bacterium]